MRFNPLNNLTLKIGAILLALLLWVHVATNKTYEYQVAMTLRVANVPRGLIVVSDLPGTVDVRVKTTGKQLIALATKEHTFTLDAAEFREGSFEYDLTDREAAAAFDQVYERVDLVFPRKLFLRLENQAEKNLLVESGAKAVAAPGFLIVGRPRIEPEMVRVTGPASAIRGLKAISTEPVELNGLTTSTSHTVRIAVPDSLHLTLGDSLVTISFMVEQMTERVVPEVNIRAPYDFDASRYTFSPTTIALRVGIPISQRDSVDLRSIRASFAAMGEYADSVKAPIKFILPKNVSIVGHAVDSVLIRER